MGGPGMADFGAFDFAARRKGGEEVRGAAVVEDLLRIDGRLVAAAPVVATSYGRRPVIWGAAEHRRRGAAPLITAGGGR